MPTITENKLRFRRNFPVSLDKAWRAFSDENLLAKWFAPSDAFSVRVEELPVRFGGRFRVTMSDDAGEYTVSGVYEKVEKPHSLWFTWNWETDKEEWGHNRVCVEFRDTDGNTELTLTHGLFPNKELLRKHEAGWNGCLDRLAKVLK